MDALAASEGDFAGSPARLRAAGALFQVAGDAAAAAEAFWRAYGANPASDETARQLEEALRAAGPDAAPRLLELLADRAARAQPGSERAAALVQVADVHAQNGAPDRAEAALRAALADAPAHPAAEDRLLALLAATRRTGERARLLLERSARLHDGDTRTELRREAGRALATSPDATDRELAAEAWRAVAASRPEDLEAARAAAGLLLGLRRREEAVPHLAALVRADPDDDSAASELALAYASSPLQRGELFLARAARAAGEARATRLREAATALYEAGDEDRARAALRDAFEAWPADGAAFAEALRDASSDPGRLDAVLSARARALSLPRPPPATAPAPTSSTRPGGRRTRSSRTRRRSRRAPETPASSPRSRPASRRRAATPPRRRSTGSWSRAPRRAAGEVPGAAEAPARFRLGLALSFAGKAIGAVPHLERALSLAPFDGHAGLAWAALAQGYAARGDGAGALAAAHARIERATVLGLEEEKRAALEAEAELAFLVGLPSALGPSALEAGSPADWTRPPAFGTELPVTEPGTDLEPEAAIDLAASAEPDPGAEPGGPAFAPEPGQAEETPASLAAAWIATAEALLRSGAAAEEVHAALDLACGADPDSPEPWRATARVELELGDPLAAARAHLSVSIRAEGNDAAVAALEAARLFEEGGRDADAARAYRAAVLTRPGLVPDPVLLAAEALAAGNPGAAAQLLSAVDPPSLPPEIRGGHARKLARTLEAAGRVEEAERAWSELLAAAPADDEAFARAAALAEGRAGVDGWLAVSAARDEALAATADAARRVALRIEAGEPPRRLRPDGGGCRRARRGARARSRRRLRPRSARGARGPPRRLGRRGRRDRRRGDAGARRRRRRRALPARRPDPARAALRQRRRDRRAPRRARARALLRVSLGAVHRGRGGGAPRRARSGCPRGARAAGARADWGPRGRPRRGGARGPGRRRGRRRARGAARAARGPPRRGRRPARGDRCARRRARVRSEPRHHLPLARRPRRRRRGGPRPCRGRAPERARDVRAGRLGGFRG